MALKVAVQLYSIRGDVAKDMRAALEKVKAMGYDGVEFAGIGTHTAKEIKDMCEEIGLVPISAHVTFADMRKDPEATLAVYSEIGCKFVAVPYLVPQDRPGTDGFAKTIEDVAMIGKVAKKMGMQLLITTTTLSLSRSTASMRLIFFTMRSPLNIFRQSLTFVG